MKARIN